MIKTIKDLHLGEKTFAGDKAFAGDSESAAHYALTSLERDLPPLWQQYAAALACELFGQDYEVGDAFILTGEIMIQDAQGIVKDMATTGKFRTRHCPDHPFNVLRSDTAAIPKRVWRAQTKVCLPLLEIERSAFISAQYGRLLGIMGADYWDPKTKDYKYLWNHDCDRQMEDPFELSLAELSKLSYRVKRLVMLNTFSYPPFYRVETKDRDRLIFAADLWDRLTHFRLCVCEEMDTLFSGHEQFIRR